MQAMDMFVGTLCSRISKLFTMAKREEIVGLKDHLKMDHFSIYFMNE